MATLQDRLYNLQPRMRLQFWLTIENGLGWGSTVIATHLRPFSWNKEMKSFIAKRDISISVILRKMMLKFDILFKEIH
jgi:hypothetical protein